jgi:hypothetical protein
MVEMDGPSVMADGAAALVCTWCNQTDTDQKCGRTRRSVPLRDAAWAKPSDRRPTSRGVSRPCLGHSVSSLRRSNPAYSP